MKAVSADSAASWELDQPPSILNLYAKALVKGGRLSVGDVLPKLSVRQRRVSIDTDHLAQYLSVCGFSDASALPTTYLHMLAFPLHMTLLTAPRFPAKLLGTVHVRNKITVLAKVDARTPLDIFVELGEQREVTSGIEFDINTKVESGGQSLWLSTSTMLCRCKTGVPKDSVRKEITTLEEPVIWSVPNDIGRCYGRVSKDINPIHLSALSAKLFGFKRAIAHGMWTKARCLAALQDELPEEGYAVEVEFKRPVFLPSDVQFSNRKSERDSGCHWDFVLLNAEGDVPHLIGSIESIPQARETY